MSKYARRVDANHNPIVANYEKMGVAVIDLSKMAQFHPGLPDLLCSLHGYTWFSETKTDIGELSPAQTHFMAMWKGACKVVRTTDDVVAIVADVRAMTGAGRFVKRVEFKGVA